MISVISGKVWIFSKARVFLSKFGAIYTQKDDDLRTANSSLFQTVTIW